MKVIFLDIDGVMNYNKCPWFFNHETMERRHVEEHNKEWGGFYAICPDRVTILLSILEKTGAKLVLSSTWRKNERWKEIMRCNGLDSELFLGRTVVLGGFRGEEIKEWLDKNPGVEKFAIIDDDADMLAYQKPSFFQTNFMNGGLNQEIADRIIEHLNQ